MKTKARPVFLGFLCVFAAASCGGGDDEVRVVERSKALTELTPAELASLCEWGQSVISTPDFRKVTCYAATIAFGSLDPSTPCEKAVENCLSSSEPVEQECHLDSPKLPACAAKVSVSDMKACYKASAAAFSKLAQTVTCDTDLEQLGAAFTGHACVDVKEKCPELLQSEDEGPAPMGPAPGRSQR